MYNIFFCVWLLRLRYAFPLLLQVVLSISELDIMLNAARKTQIVESREEIIINNGALA
jgi:hypothetical protein